MISEEWGLRFSSLIPCHSIVYKIYNISKSLWPRRGHAFVATKQPQYSLRLRRSRAFVVDDRVPGYDRGGEKAQYDGGTLNGTEADQEAGAPEAPKYGYVYTTQDASGNVSSDVSGTLAPTISFIAPLFLDEQGNLKFPFFSAPSSAPAPDPSSAPQEEATQEAAQEAPQEAPQEASEEAPEENQ